MKKIILFVITLAFSCSVFANPGEGNKSAANVDSFKIIVIDANTEEPIPAAKIKIGKKELKAYTDFDGLAEFKELVQGIYDIEVSFISYQKQQLNAFQVDNNTNQLLIKLHP